MPELDMALRTIQSQTGIDKLDMIGFDACLMSQLDVMQTIAPYGRVAVASAELEPNDGWAWDVWLKQLNQDPAQDSAKLAGTIVDSYQQYYEKGNDDTVTLAAFDLEKIGALRDSFAALSDAMRKNLGDSYQAIAEARSGADAYSQPKPEQFSAIDLGDFTRLIGRQGAQGEVAAAAEALGKQLADARIAEWHGSFHDRSTGLSVFFPQVAELYPDFYEKGSPLPRDTSWASFLKEFYQAGGQQVSAPVIDDLRLSSPTVVDAYIEILGKEKGFQHGDTGEVKSAGQPGLMFKYSYTDKQGRALSGVAIAITSPTSGLSYAISAQALAADFDAQADTFDKILASITIE